MPNFVDICNHLWLQLGAVGLLVAILIMHIWRTDKRIEQDSKRHRGERDEWRQESQAQTNTMINVVKSNTSVVSELCTLIKNK